MVTSRAEIVGAWHRILWPIVTQGLGLMLVFNETVLRDDVRSGVLAIGLTLCAGGNALDLARRVTGSTSADH